MKLLDAQLLRGRLQSVSFSDSLTTIHYSFAGMSSQNLHFLQSRLQEISPVAKVNVYFNRQGVLT